MSPEMRCLDLQLSDGLRAECIAFLKRITEYQPTLCITKGWSDGDPTERWTYGAYGPDNLEALSPEYQQLGMPLLHEVSGLTVAIPQTQLLSELEGKTLVRTPKGIEVRERNGDI